MPERGYFAMGLDRDPQGRPRQIESQSSNAALLLSSTVFDDLPDRQRYIAGLVSNIYTSNFVTDVGVRCRSLVEDDLVDFQDYHGTWPNWQKDGYDVACGLERQRFMRLAEQLYARLLNGVNVAGAPVEFLYVSPEQQVHYDFADHDLVSAHPREIHGTNRPEPMQTWTVTAMLAIKSRKGTASMVGRSRAPFVDSADGGAGIGGLETDLMATLPPLKPFRTAEEREAVYALRGDFILTPSFGVERDQAARTAGQGRNEAVGH